MSYEPRGKVKTLIDAMRAQPDKPVWTAPEVAATMHVPQANLPAYLGAAVRHRVLFRELDSGKSFFSLQPFGVKASPPARGPGASDPAWRPPVMTPPRGTPSPTKAPDLSWPGPSAVAAAQPEVPPAEPEPKPQEAEATDFNACLWLDGDLDLHGLIEIEGGGYRVPAKDVMRLRKVLAWMPC